MQMHKHDSICVYANIYYIGSTQGIILVKKWDRYISVKSWEHVLLLHRLMKDGSKIDRDKSFFLSLTKI